jgi:hypothetical protein
VLKNCYKNLSEKYLIKFYSFDVQKEVGHNFEKLSRLDDLLSKELKDYKISNNDEKQNKVFRVNCKGKKYYIIFIR